MPAARLFGQLPRDRRAQVVAGPAADEALAVPAGAGSASMRRMSRSRPVTDVEIRVAEDDGIAVHRREQVAGPALEVEIGAEAVRPEHQHGRGAADRARSAQRAER